MMNADKNEDEKPSPKPKTDSNSPVKNTSDADKDQLREEEMNKKATENANDEKGLDQAW